MEVLFIFLFIALHYLSGSVLKEAKTAGTDHRRSNNAAGLVLRRSYFKTYEEIKYMRFIPTKIHGILDYLVAVLLISSPWLFRFNLGGWETWIPVALGVSAIVYSLITKYEAGIWDLIPMRSHLVIDFVSGFLLFFSPWIFGFNIHVFLPHLIMGLVEMGASIMTKQVPSTSYKDKFIHQV